MKRSYLFVPGNRPARFDKACECGAHAVIVDLEDAVAPDEKATARDAIANWLQPRHRIYLRINAVDTEWFTDDLRLVRSAGVAGVLLPKAESAQSVAAVTAARSLDLAVVPLIETAVGILRAEAIAGASNVERLAFGSIDFQLDTGIAGDGDELLLARSHLVLASRAASVQSPIDGVTLALDDESALRADVERAKRLGFGAKLCIHPRQVAAVNAGFAPSDQEIDWARRVVEAANEAGGNAVRLDGKMVDRPVIERARVMLSQVEA
jgi:citrate lyase subunit beta/citryl-CoA lyase